MFFRIVVFFAFSVQLYYTPNPDSYRDLKGTMPSKQFTGIIISKISPTIPICVLKPNTSNPLKTHISIHFSLFKKIRKHQRLDKTNSRYPNSQNYGFENISTSTITTSASVIHIQIFQKFPQLLKSVFQKLEAR